MATAAADAGRPPRAQRRRLVARTSLLGRLVRRPAGCVSVAAVAGVLAVAALGPLIAPHDPAKVDIANRLMAPTETHPLGTDHLGRDSLSRVIFGARTALVVAIPAVAGAFAVGLLLGLLTGYVGGAVDKVLTTLLDAILAFPTVILGLTMLTLLGPSLSNTILVIAVAFLPWYARLARAQTLAAKQNPYVTAERSLGASRARILAVHILPNVLPPLLILLALDIPSAIGVEAVLSFLGLGVQPPTSDWGVMVAEGFEYVRTTAWPLVGPLVGIVVVTAAITLLGETLRDITDPKLAGGRRRGVRIRGVRKA